ncbi:hypothetical protein DY000_02050218 [Brassica cretica]|uniref:Uncharacterized protein n=1 Tax=Brassica cretica TaxID=69181 RepID=A0ABQ7ER02_BRACR|nr:hypothetical protein DY000_02050218 [Brassica cretica]
MDTSIFCRNVSRTRTRDVPVPPQRTRYVRRHQLGVPLPPSNVKDYYLDTRPDPDNLAYGSIYR